MDRNLAWDGFFNARDLGGLPTADGHRTRWGALVRSEAPDKLTQAGWAALYDHGVRTVVDLRNDDELGVDDVPRPEGLDLVRVALDPVEDHGFWDHYRDSGLHATPLYYEPLLNRRPDLVRALVAAVARARPGGVLIHCAAGRDRTGLAALLLLGLVGVPASAIVDDYRISIDRLPSLHQARGTKNLEPVIAGMLAERGTTADAVVLSAARLASGENYLRELAIPDQDRTALRRRLLADAPV
jgi:protein-tyrosine phosphatase